MPERDNKLKPETASFVAVNCLDECLDKEKGNLSAARNVLILK